MARLLLLYRSQRLFDMRHQREDAGQRLRESDTVFQGQVVIVPHRRKRGELAGKSWSPVIALHGSHDAPQRPRLGGDFWRNRRSYDKACHQRLFRSQEMYHFRPNVDLGSNSGTYAFEPPVNTEQVRSLTADAQHEGFAGNIHPVVLVCDAAWQWGNNSIAGTPSRNLVHNALDMLIHH